MSRTNLGVTWGFGLVLLLNVPLASAMDAATANANSLGNAGINDTELMELTVPTVNDPAAIDMLFKEGNTIASILDGLKEKGFHIKYKEKQFLPTMTLQSLPTASRIDEVLAEILEPWNFRVYRSPFGHWVVTPSKKKASEEPNENTRELLERYKDRIQDDKSKS